MPDDIRQVVLTAVGTLLAAFVVIIAAGAAAIAKRINVWGGKTVKKRRRTPIVTESLKPPKNG